MPEDLASRLEEWKYRFGTDTQELRLLLAEIERSRITDSGTLIRLHECLLFLRAYPADPQVMKMAARILSSFAQRTADVADTAPFEEPEVSGIAGTSFSAVFSYEVARGLCSRYPRDIEIDWENYDQTDKLGPVLRRFVRLVAEDWPVEAHVPFRAWVDAARPRQSSALVWLLEKIGSLPLSEREQADLYESMELLLIWQIGTPGSRSRMRLSGGTPFYHHEPLLRRSDISLARELEAAPLPVRRLAKAESQQVLELIMDNSAMRYRELYGFTHPDARRVFHADAGRGVEIIFFGVPAEWRLPFRAYHCGMFFKNGVPAGYIELLSLFDRAEVGFNLYYTFRDGESAWLYARLLRLFRQILGASYFSVDPYQVGYENDEAIASGAFWFYRKMGFRPLDADVAELVQREERRMSKTSGYRSSRRTLERMAQSYMLYECAGAEPGIWDRFRVRKLGQQCTQRHLSPLDARLMEAKHGPDEIRYLQLMQQDKRLRAEIIKLGS